MYSIKTIKVTIQLRQGGFINNNNTVIIEGLPTSVQITKSGGDSKNKAVVTIQNMKLETIKQLTTLAFKRLETYNNVIQIDVGSQGGSLTTAFLGEITTSVPVIDSDGTLSLRIEALAGYYPNLLPTPPTSVQGSATIDELMRGFATEAGYSYENKNISGSVANCVFIGSPITKAKTLARQTGIDLLIDDNKFTIQTLNAPKTGEVPLVNKDSGLLGYPSFSNDGIRCKCIYNEYLKVGGYFKLESILPHATGEWQITKLSHSLEAYLPQSGAWETEITAVLPGGSTNG